MRRFIMKILTGSVAPLAQTSPWCGKVEWQQVGTVRREQRRKKPPSSRTFPLFPKRKYFSLRGDGEGSKKTWLLSQPGSGTRGFGCHTTSPGRIWPTQLPGWSIPKLDTCWQLYRWLWGFLLSGYCLKGW